MDKRELTFDTLLAYCQKEKGRLARIDGNCKHCPNFRKCLRFQKHSCIISLSEMDKSETRFPGWLFDWIQAHPRLLFLVPSVVYCAMYGMHSDYLPCAFIGGRIPEHLEDIRKVLDMLTDAESRRVYLSLLMYRLTMEPEYIHQVYKGEPQYFIEAFQHLGPNEVYVDCGAFIGDTFIEYCRYNAPPKEAWLFEPNPENNKMLRKTIESYEKETRFTIIDKGVYQSSGSLYFTENKAKSSFSETPGKHSKEIEVVSIDDLIEENITFLKMDIEGLEQKALLGAKEHICRDYPKLAICIYHYVEDLWEIPLLIKSLAPDYNRFAIRHHNDEPLFGTFAESVLYVYKE